jgi:hypothetical protein
MPLMGKGVGEKGFKKGCKPLFQVVETRAEGAK